MSGGSHAGDQNRPRSQSRSRRARLTVVAMVAVLVVGVGAATLVLSRRPAPTDDAAAPVIDQARQLAVATAAYDDSGLVQAEALRIAALANLSTTDLPGFLQGDVEGYERLRSRSRADLVTDLLVQDDTGRRAHEQLVATPGYRETDAVAATLGPLPADRIQRLRDSGATRADLAPYESAIVELDGLHQARDPAQAQLLQSVAALEKAPAAGAVPLDWGLLAAIAIAVLAIEIALGFRLTHLVGAAEADVASEADRRREQVVSMFLVARRLTSGRPGPAIAATVAEETSWTLDADFAFVMLVDGVTLVPVASYGDVRAARIASSSGLLGRCADTVQPQHETVPADPSLPDEAGPLTLMAAPVLIRQRVGGVLVAGRRGTAPFAPDDETALTLLAHVTGGALEHAPAPADPRPRPALAASGGPGGSTGDVAHASTVDVRNVDARSGDVRADDPTRRPPRAADADADADADAADADPDSGADADADADVVDVAVPSVSQRDRAPTAAQDRASDGGPDEDQIAPAPAPAPAAASTPAPGPAPSTGPESEPVPEASSEAQPAARPEAAPRSGSRSEPEPRSEGAARLAPSGGLPEALVGVDSVVRVLLPDLEVRRGGVPQKLAGASARLLAVLIAHRQPVTVDKLADLLWPDIDLAAGRNRLNVTVHRLRKSLGLANDELLVRSADGIALVPGSQWRIDAWLFWDLSGADRDGPAHVQAYDLHEAAFCARQFAYEDAVGLERDRILARWSDVTVGLLADGVIDAATAADRALAFGVLDEDVLRTIADAVERAGHTAQAATLIAAIDDGRHLA